MPVMGPDKLLAYKQGKNAFEKVMELLTTEYHIRDVRKKIICPNNGKEFHSFFEKSLKKDTKKLKKAIQKLFWSNACDVF